MGVASMLNSDFSIQLPVLAVVAFAGGRIDDPDVLHAHPPVVCQALLIGAEAVFG